VSRMWSRRHDGGQFGRNPAIDTWLVRILMHQRFSDRQVCSEEPWHRRAVPEPRPDYCRDMSASSIGDEPPPQHHQSQKRGPIVKRPWLCCFSAPRCARNRHDPQNATAARADPFPAPMCNPLFVNSQTTAHPSDIEASIFEKASSLLKFHAIIRFSAFALLACCQTAVTPPRGASRWHSTKLFLRDRDLFPNWHSLRGARSHNPTDIRPCSRKLRESRGSGS
jgi:hypothetical protein